MTDGPSRLEDLFERAVVLPREERSAFLDRHCADDAGLRQRLLSMLTQDDEGTKEYLVSPVSDSVDVDRVNDLGGNGSAPDPTAPSHVGPFRILEQIGWGGMGRVYVALQQEPVHRKVALKVIRIGVGTPGSVERFEQERQALALMDHPNICQIFDGGSTEEGLPYFVMEYVEGARSLTTFAAEESLTLRQRLKLFLHICSAVHHGHQKGVLHRDLKPSNILVSRDGIPKLIDFGVARSLTRDAPADSRLTGEGRLLGTLQYMSPEQVRVGGGGDDVRSDVYSLGVILYELLTEQLPYEISDTSLVEAARTIETTAPKRPSGVNPRLGGDVETILLRALHKEPEHRYASVHALAFDIDRYLRSQTILARPPSIRYQLRLFARRHRGLAAGLSAALLALTAGGIASLVAAMRANDAADRAEDVTTLLFETFENIEPFQLGGPVSIREMLKFMDERLDERFSDRPLDHGRLLAMIGRAHDSLGDYAEAEEHIARACEILDGGGYARHPHGLHARSLLGNIYSEQGKFLEAKAHQSEVLPDLLEVLGETHGDTLNVLEDLAWVSLQLGEEEEADDYARAAVEGYTRRFGPTDPETLPALVLRARVDSALGDVERAEGLLTHVLAIEREEVGGERANTLFALAVVYDEHGRSEEAVPLLEKAVEIDIEILGEDDPWTLEARAALGRVHLDQGRIVEAEEILADVLRRSEVVLGPDHPETLTCANALGRVYFTEGRYGAAEPLLLKAVNGMRDRPGHERSLGPYLLDWGRLLMELARFEEAEGALLEARRRLTASRRADDPGIREAAATLARLYSALGRPALAAEWGALSPEGAPEHRR